MCLFKRKHWKIHHLYSFNQKKVTRIHKNREKKSYMLQFIDSVRFMTSSLSNLVKNLSKGIHKIKCKYGHDNKKCEIRWITYEVCDCFLECRNFKDDLIEYKYYVVTKIINKSLMKNQRNVF